MIEMKEITIADLKVEITDKILHGLPNWFKIEKSIAKYIEKSADLPFWGAFDNKQSIGFLMGLYHNGNHMELCAMGILEEYHRQSIGRGLFNIFQNYCIKEGFSYISVKTLDNSSPCKYYEITRKFYEAVGFIPFEVIPKIWNEQSSCLIMIKDLKDAANSYKCKN